MQQLASPADMSSLIKDIRQDAREIRQDAKVERDELESKLKAEYKVEMQQQKAETEARHTAELDRLRNEVDKLKAEHKAEMNQLRGELTPAPAPELVSAEQLAALQARLESLHAAQLLSDEEFFALEDLCGDFIELQGSTVGVLSQDLVCSSAAYSVAARLAKVVGLSEGLASDAGFARQARRKLV